MQDNNLGGFLSGLLVGAAVSALFTPQSGEKTREKLKSLAEDKFSSFQDSLEDRRSQIQEELERIEGEIRKRIPGGDDQSSPTKNAAKQKQA